MSHENVEVVRDQFAATNERDFSPKSSPNGRTPGDMASTAIDLSDVRTAPGGREQSAWCSAQVGEALAKRPGPSG